jgi:hypothetical protein
MAEMYFKLVTAKRRTCNAENTAVKQVPAAFREQVVVLLGERGYDTDGNRI